MRVLLVYAFAALLLLLPQAATAADRTPLLQEGKKSLYQRVVTHPGAVLRQAPGNAADAGGPGSAADAGGPGTPGTPAIAGTPITPFSVFYVYGKLNGSLEVGPSATAPSGWVAEKDATFWPQAMTLLFSDRTGRMPVLFFKEEQNLRDICAADDLKDRLDALEKKVEQAKGAGGGTDDLPVLAAEPSDTEGAVSRERFYLMPIKHMTDPFEGTKFLKVASIDPGGDAGAKGGKGGSDDGKSKDAKPETMRTGIVFVLDTTISMKPYIEQSLNVVRSTFDRIEKEQLGESVGFAVIAFRNSTASNAKVGYTTLKVSDFATLKDRKTLEDALAKVEEATVSTHSFNEDSLSGIKTAVDGLSWQDYHSRVIVLITDAGPLPTDDPLAGTKMAPAEMLDYAKAKNIWLTVAHIQSPSGKSNHKYAEKTYRELTRTASGEASYMPIAAPTPKQGAENFAKTAKALAESLTQVVKATAELKAPVKPKPADKEETPEQRARRIGETIGYAMQLEFLGKQRENRAPEVIDAWIADMDLAKLADGDYAPTVEVAVLLSKNQLSDLQRTLQIIVDQAERTKKTDSRDFFQSILSASAQLARDPAAFSARPGQNLQETGVLGEFLEGLPYKSDIMLLREEDWYRMSVGEQTAFINRLKSRITRYEEYDKDRSNWESFGAANPGDWLYRVPLSVLP